MLSAVETAFVFQKAAKPAFSGVLWQIVAGRAFQNFSQQLPHPVFRERPAPRHFFRPFERNRHFERTLPFAFLRRFFEPPSVRRREASEPEGRVFPFDE